MSRNFKVQVVGVGGTSTIAKIFSAGRQFTVEIGEPHLSADEIEARIEEGYLKVLKSSVDIEHILPNNLNRLSKRLKKGSAGNVIGWRDPPQALSTRAPPRLAEFLFSLLASKKTVNAELGDMQELFERRVKTHGVPRARMLYWSQVLRAVGPGVWRFVRKWGLIGFLIDYGRSKLGL